MFTKIEIAQYAVNTIIAGVAADAAATVITDHSEKTKDDKLVKIPSGLFGFVVANQLKPHTDALIVKTAARYTTFKNRKDTTE